jgi:hypothetical protein
MFTVKQKDKKKTKQFRANLTGMFFKGSPLTIVQRTEFHAELWFPLQRKDSFKKSKELELARNIQLSKTHTAESIMCI